MLYTQIRSTSISRVILGGNPLRGISHQSLVVDQDMRDYYTKNRVHLLFQEAESLGINSLVARVDDYILDFLSDYGLRDHPFHWLAQTAPEAGHPLVSAARAAEAGALGCHIHGGVMDNYLAQGMIDKVPEIIRQIRGMGMLAGIAGHKPEVFEWARENLDVDYFTCSYYNPTPRDQHAEHIHGSAEQFLESDRLAMTDVISSLPAPVIHYKIFAAGRNDPQNAIEFAASKMRPQDMACIGIFPKHLSTMLQEDVAWFEDALQKNTLRVQNKSAETPQA